MFNKMKEKVSGEKIPNSMKSSLKLSLMDRLSDTSSTRNQEQTKTTLQTLNNNNNNNNTERVSNRSTNSKSQEQKKLKELEGKYEKLNERYNKISSALKLSKNDVTQLTEENSRHLQKINDQNKIVGEYQENDRKLKEAFDMVSAKHSDRLEELDEMRKKNREKDNLIEKLRGELKELKMENEKDEMRNELNEKNWKIKELNDELDDLRRSLHVELNKMNHSSLDNHKTATNLFKMNEQMDQLGNNEKLPNCTNLIFSNKTHEPTEVDLIYLKHVVLKFITNRDCQPIHLSKAISILLQLSNKEEMALSKYLATSKQNTWFSP
ncbi:hypothetical protein SNEBB_009474 [Seison nebaliae]|nr:hypothetical protein SNEBB_009474 [Seison nebaliae]